MHERVHVREQAPRVQARAAGGQRSPAASTEPGALSHSLASKEGLVPLPAHDSRGAWCNLTCSMTSRALTAWLMTASRAAAWVWVWVWQVAAPQQPVG